MSGVGIVLISYAYPELEIYPWDNGHIRVLAALPITAAERALKINEGIEQLEQGLEDAGADFANPRRPSVAWSAPSEAHAGPRHPGAKLG